MASPWFVRFQGVASHRTKLFCFPYAGAGPALYRDWAGVLPGVEIVAVQLPGRERRFGEAPIDRLDLMIDAMLESVGMEATGSFSFFGHSMGALLAFELSHAMRRSYGVEPELLFVSGSPAPRLTKSYQDDSEGLPFEARLRKLGGTPPEVLNTPGLLDLFTPILRADFALVDEYIYVKREAVLGCRTIALRGADDPFAPESAVREWAAETRGTFCLHCVKGAHFEIGSDPGRYIEVVGAHIGGSAECRVSDGD